MYQNLLELKNKRAQKLAEGKELLAKKDYEGHKTLMEEIDKLNGEIDAIEKQLAEEGRFEDGDEGMANLAKGLQKKKKDDAAQKSVDEIRGTKEYARAFAKAMRDGARVKTCAGVEAYAPLYKALTESGGAPTGSDGGFLVPIDFDNMIIELSRDYLDLSTFFNVENVTAPSGWRVVEAGTPKPLPKVAEMAVIGKTDQPKFTRVDYTVEKFADRLPVSNELLEDEVANLLAYLARWFVPKYILTKNSLLIGMLTGLTKSVTLTEGSEDKILRSALIKQLNTAQSRTATLLTNQSGYAAMDGWEDKNGRPLLVPNPADAQAMRYRGRPVAYGDDTELTAEEGGNPIYVGNFKQVGTLFVRKGIEIASTNVGGDAWATDSTELRAICRMGAAEVDPTAAFKALIPTGV